MEGGWQQEFMGMAHTSCTDYGEIRQDIGQICGDW